MERQRQTHEVPEEEAGRHAAKMESHGWSRVADHTTSEGTIVFEWVREPTSTSRDRHEEAEHKVGNRAFRRWQDQLEPVGIEAVVTAFLAVMGGAGYPGATEISWLASYHLRVVRKGSKHRVKRNRAPGWVLIGTPLNRNALDDPRRTVAHGYDVFPGGRCHPQLYLATDGRTVALTPTKKRVKNWGRDFIPYRAIVRSREHSIETLRAIGDGPTARNGLFPKLGKFLDAGSVTWPAHLPCLSPPPEE